VDRENFKAALAALGIQLSEQQLDQFQAFEDNLYQANEVMNLTRISKDECWLRHFVDSLLFQDLIPVGASVLDIGTGPGFPAWPLACARADLKVTGLDSSGKMTGFLQKNSLPNLSVVLGRAEEWGVREQFDVVTGRALAPLGIQLELSAAPCRVKGVILAMRTPADESVASELPVQTLGLEFRAVERRSLPTTDIVRIFPVYRKVKQTSHLYPRTWAEIKRDPIS